MCMEKRLHLDARNFTCAASAFHLDSLDSGWRRQERQRLNTTLPPTHSVLDSMLGARYIAQSVPGRFRLSTSISDISPSKRCRSDKLHRRI